MLESKLDMSKFEIVDKTFSMKKANLVGTLAMFPIFIVSFAIYFSIYSWNIFNYNGLHVFIAIIIGIVIHEFVHGFTWHLFCDYKWKSIKFGIDKKTLSPFAHCKEVLNVKNYRIGAISPFIITGLFPFIVSLIINNSTLAYTSIILMCCAIGDLMILYTILKEKSSSLVIDHPTKCGCTVYRLID